MSWRKVIIKLYVFLFAIIFNVGAMAVANEENMTSMTIKSNPEDRIAILTKNGYVSFEADPNWIVFNVQTQAPNPFWIFQIPNIADLNTSHSANLAINLLYPDTIETKELSGKIGRKLGHNEVDEMEWNGWKLYRQIVAQNSIPYTIMEAQKNVADVKVYVMLAWPHLEANSSNHNKNMEDLMFKFIYLLKGDMGAFPMTENQTIMRSDK